MTTPIFDFVKKYSDSQTSRFHMPGHKGFGPLGCERYDITEIDGADVLCLADGIIEESENNLTELYGTAHSFYSTEGSTLAICAMLTAVSRRRTGEGKPLILAARNVHTAFVKAAALLDLDVEWLYPEKPGHLCSCDISFADLGKALEKMDKKPQAVYVTSPDYLGNMLDISGLSAVCREYGLPLLVDNAHGAYLRFLTKDCHPITLGASMCADSAHKTLPVLTGGAYLHVSREYPEYVKDARRALSLFSSTSPSYLTLLSLDLCNKRLREDYPEGIALACKRVSKLKDAINDLGFYVEEGEPLKVVINAGKSGFTGQELGAILRRDGIEPEFSDRDYLVLMPSPDNSEGDYIKVAKALGKIAKKDESCEFSMIFSPIEHKAEMSIREAVLSLSETVAVEEAVGRICASPTVSCPPAVPIVISGEKITEEDVLLFKHYGVEKVSVVTE